MRLDCGCDTLTGAKCKLHEFAWSTTKCPSCGYERALKQRHGEKVYCEACGRYS